MGYGYSGAQQGDTSWLGSYTSGFEDGYSGNTGDTEYGTPADPPTQTVLTDIEKIIDETFRGRRKGPGDASGWITGFVGREEQHKQRVPPGGPGTYSNRGTVLTSATLSHDSDRRAPVAAFAAAAPKSGLDQRGART